jgi:hypothetical protein
LLLQLPAALGMDSRTDEAIQKATFEFLAPSTDARRDSLVGTAFVIGPNKFITAAHLLIAAIGSHFSPPQVVDGHDVGYRIAEILQFSELHDYAIFSVEHPPDVRPLAISGNDRRSNDVYFAGWRPWGIGLGHGRYTGLTRDSETDEFSWIRFEGELWNSAGGGPLLDTAGQVMGILQARARDMGPNYALPIGLLSADTTAVARIRATQMLQALMPLVSAPQPMEAELPLPSSFDEFSRQLVILRQEYVARTVQPLLEATRGNFVLSGTEAAEACHFLNGQACQCRGPRLSGSLVLDSPGSNDQLVRVSSGEGASQRLAGVLVGRTPESGAAQLGSKHDLATNSLLQLGLALKSSQSDRHPLQVVSKSAEQEQLYIDYHGRSWYLRVWPLQNRDQTMVSLARDLTGSYVSLTRVVPTSLTSAAILQTELVANLIYYHCDDSPAEGAAMVAWR